MRKRSRRCMIIIFTDLCSYPHCQVKMPRQGLRSRVSSFAAQRAANIVNFSKNAYQHAKGLESPTCSQVKCSVAGCRWARKISSQVGSLYATHLLQDHNCKLHIDPLQTPKIIIMLSSILQQSVTSHSNTCHSQ